MRAAVLGLGEAGCRYAADLAAGGVVVRGYDTRAVDPPPAVTLAASVADAVTGAELVLSLTTAAGSLDAAAAAAAFLQPETVYADLNAASPALKETVAGGLGTGLFADVAVLAPVPRDGVRTPVLVSGPGAEAYRELLSRFGGRIEIVPGGPGAAASRKLLRSIFMKSLATTILEALAAGRAADCEDWVRAQIIDELDSAGPDLVERLVAGTYQHAQRRLHEMADTKSYVDELGSPTEMTAASIAWLSGIAAGQRR
jgi:3-hydroxyisobutyrate dehydrogenase-like beta-hydroxyacid dehydrogenase